MSTRHRALRYGTRMKWLGLFCALAMGPGMADVVVTLESGVAATPGATAEVSVSLDWTDDTPPSTLVLGVGYDRSRVTPDTAWFELIERDRAGRPVRGDNGETRTLRTPAAPAAALSSAGKGIDFNVIDPVDAPAGEGVLLVAIAGGKEAIPRGAMLTLAFRAAADLYGTATLRGLDTGHPAFYGTEPPLVSSAADAAGNALPVVVQQGSLVVNGCAPAAVPADVQATTDRSDGVRITWTPVTGLEYRVFRQSADDPSPLPLGTTWTQEGAFLDESAPRPARAGGCLSATFTPVTSRYWVVSRDRLTRCPAQPSGEGVEGSRAGGSLFSLWFGCSKRLVTHGVEPPLALAAPVLLLLARRKKG